LTDIPTKVNLGSGNQNHEEFFAVDIVETDSVDRIQDLDSKDWDLPKNHFSIVKAIDVFEHLDNPVQFMENLHEICVDGAEVVIRSPHFSSMNWHDPTHKRMVGSRTFDNFTHKGRFQYYSDVQYRLKDFEITFEWSPFPGYRKIGYWIANNYTDIYEKSFLKNLFPAPNIEFKLEVLS